MGITKEFSEVHPLGMNTGNNTGVYPDNLLIYSYYVFPGIEGGIKLTGLNLALKYDLTIIGSTQGWGNLNTVYTINGKKYYFNSSLNVGKGSLIIYGLSPDQNGEINLTLERGSNESPGGYLNAFMSFWLFPPV
ncbi:MAG: hypothetical protein IPL53_21145 [Ignavibacteria bacterium]|nr:hypothetical protein [Ignavibacteria bacterium]